jgi:hypothetical protein
MSDKIWFVSVNSAQRDGQYTTAEVASILESNAGASILVWKEGLANWVDARSMPEFQTAAPAAPAPVAPAPPVAAPRTAPHASSARSRAVMDRAGFIKALLDFRFDSFVTPRMISVLYGVVMALIGLAAVGLIISSLMAIFGAIRFHSFTGVLTGLLMMALAPILAVVYLAMTRMFFEVVIVLFKIKDNTEKIAGG